MSMVLFGSFTLKGRWMNRLTLSLVLMCAVAAQYGCATARLKGPELTEEERQELLQAPSALVLFAADMASDTRRHPLDARCEFLGLRPFTGSAAPPRRHVGAGEPRVAGWNEIDAVELSDGSTSLWASRATASSSYSDN